MLIPAVESGLESLLRATLPLSAEQGDISFDAPSSTWSAQVNRLTVNLFLYGVTRSSQPPRSVASRTTADGTVQARYPLPMVQLAYLVSAWAGSTRDEHELLGDVLTRFLAHQVIPAEHMSTELSSNVQLALADDSVNRPREIWSGLGGTLRGSFTLLVTVAADAYDWRTMAPPATEVVGSANPLRPKKDDPTTVPARAAGPRPSAR